ncbi:MAG TPA: lysophospholipid acyltransferase family protein [bacterium]|nr:lysophospholipid acyltransferase family protein [bacterium]HPN42372.1 lysophospholipid acyltransferase family protein [bacterium]
MNKKTRKKIKNWFIYIAVLIVVKLLRNMSRISAIQMLRFCGALAYRLAKNERNKTLRHLTWAFGDKLSPHEIEILAQNVFRHFSTVAADAIRLTVLLKQGLGTVVEGGKPGILDDLKQAKQGAILLTGHFGNWELLGAYLAQNGYPLKVVGTSAYDKRLDKMIVDTRNLAGYQNIARGKGTREIVRHLRDNGFLGILIDQDTKVEGEFVNFFGRPAHTATGPVMLAEKFSLPVIPMFMPLFPDLKYRIITGEKIVLQNTGDARADAIANTQKCSDAYQDIISRFPEQWVWMHERWKKQPQDFVAGDE